MFPHHLMCIIMFVFWVKSNADTVYSNENDSVVLEEFVLDEMPRLIKTSDAVYPDSIIKKGVEGAVLLELLIDTSGKVDSVTVQKGIHPVLDSLSIDAARKLLFTPAISNDEAVEVFLTYEYPFYINNVIEDPKTYVNFKGRVLEKGTREPIKDAFISISYCDTCLKSSSSSYLLERKLPFDRFLELIDMIDGQWVEEEYVITQSDSLGYFNFKSLPQGVANFKIISDGHQKYFDTLSITSDSVKNITVRIEKSNNHELSVTVYGRKESEEIIARELKIDEIKTIPGFSKDVVKAVHALPGIARPAYGGEDISIRGADPTQNRYYFDGISIPYLWHFNVYGSNSIINSNVIKNMSVLSGGYGSRYGNALGGVMAFQSNDIETNTLHGVFDLGLTSTALTVEFPIKDKVGVLLSIRRDYLMSIYKFAAEKFKDEEIDWGGYYSDYFLKVQYKPNKKHDIFGVIFGTKDTLFEIYPDQSSESINKEDQLCTGKKFTQFIVGWDYKVNKKLKNTMRLGFRNIDRKEQFGDFFKIKHDGFALEIKDELNYKHNNKVLLFGGLDIHIEPDSLEIKFGFNDNEQKLGTKMNCGPLAGYLGSKFNINKKIEIKPEFRIDYYPDPNTKGALLPEFWDYDFDNTTQYSVEPSLKLSAKYNINSDHNIRFFTGTYNENSANAIMSNWIDKDYKITKGSQISLGYEAQINDHLLFSVDGYYNHQWDRTRYSTSEELQLEPNVFIRVGNKARMKGLEFLLKKEREKAFSGWVTYTIAHSERYNANLKKWELYSGDMRHNFQIIANWKLKRGVEFGTRLHITDGLPYTPKYMAYYDSDYNYYEYVEGDKNSERHSPYLGLDLRLDKTYTTKRTMITLYLESIRTLHWLSEIKKDDGTPLYSPKESNDYYYDYSGFSPEINFPLPGAGIEVKF